MSEVARMFVPVQHSCGHTRAWGRIGLPAGESPVTDQGNQGEQFTRAAVADLQLSAFIHSTADHPCPWCGATNNLAVAGRYVTEAAHGIVILDRPLWGHGIVRLNPDGTWAPVAQLERRAWMSSEDVDAIRRHVGDVDIHEGWVLDSEPSQAPRPPQPNRQARRRAARHRDRR
jgi:hypothetical protein